MPSKPQYNQGTVEFQRCKPHYFRKLALNRLCDLSPSLGTDKCISVDVGLVTVATGCKRQLEVVGAIKFVVAILLFSTNVFHFCCNYSDFYGKS